MNNVHIIQYNILLVFRCFQYNLFINYKIKYQFEKLIFIKSIFKKQKSMSSFKYRGLFPMLYK